ncbi:hypothetical protein C8J55DRAFT_14880 [Lentinula edodes]|uniref:Uncharacterized protein n=1 Tax=Lentinula lateritia TaxID=40482 RepID=A0A9W9B273_9AGAR|nr:hypothetical protein C8J55DRAFT_14880 [Lentinula edodes]
MLSPSLSSSRLFSLCLAIAFFGATVIVASPMFELHRLERRATGGQLRVGRLLSNGIWMTTFEKFKPSDNVDRFALVLCIGTRDCLTVDRIYDDNASSDVEASKLNVRRVDPPVYQPDGKPKFNHNPFWSLEGKARLYNKKEMKSQQKSEHLEVLEDVSTLFKTTGVHIDDDVSYCEAVLNYLEKKGTVENPNKVQGQWLAMRKRYHDDFIKRADVGYAEAKKHWEKFKLTTSTTYNTTAPNPNAAIPLHTDVHPHTRSNLSHHDQVDAARNLLLLSQPQIHPASNPHNEAPGLRNKK